ncbi:Maf family nucleotide pyrophosphatase [Thermotoga sp. KOL6]|uniref:Maf family nucleotide pyrophosphatase n=1 Tax=Thermotoga sp. KOL6 TaxID=126741 RepID=UPI000C78014A|nr:Maf family nucleotide pyrophosphatase [Thermotoga sp. KOL6]PLV60356.1 septum formation inhibitor Maf [Thermotoga sp. KOL6]
MKIVLASSSPRRQQLMKLLGIDFEIEYPNIDENIIGDPLTTARELALKKAEDVFQRRKDKKEILVIGSDTVVELNGETLGKPKDTEEAEEFLSKLSGKWHMVHTGVAFVSFSASDVLISSTKVKFRELPDEIIRYYVQQYKPLDKAGAYGIQDFASVFVEKVEGDFFTVVGFPIGLIWQYLYEKGWWKVVTKGKADKSRA